MLFSLLDIGASGNSDLFGLKVEIQGPRIRFHARIRGMVRKDEIAIRSEGDRELFSER
jgi:hypothetical protein